MTAVPLNPSSLNIADGPSHEGEQLLKGCDAEALDFDSWKSIVKF